MTDFKTWYKEVGFYITPNDNEDIFQFKMRLMKAAFEAATSGLMDDGK